MFSSHSTASSLLVHPEFDFDKCQEAGMPFMRRCSPTVRCFPFVMMSGGRTWPPLAMHSMTVTDSRVPGCAVNRGARSPVGTMTRSLASRPNMKPVSSMLNTFVDAMLYSRMISPRQSNHWRTTSSVAPVSRAFTIIKTARPIRDCECERIEGCRSRKPCSQLRPTLTGLVWPMRCEPVVIRDYHQSMLCA